MQCHQKKNQSNCSCTYEPCSRKGICCQCIAYHLANKELPACAFTSQAERTYDRSFKAFVSAYDK